LLTGSVGGKDDRVMSRKRKNDYIPLAWRMALSAGTQFCVYCGESDSRRLQYDHIMPLARGGAHTLDNLQLACSLCNTRKGKLTNDEFLAVLGREAMKRFEAWRKLHAKA
jgi:5-methylcytosine-specific restriction endonuclease McrA